MVFLPGPRNASHLSVVGIEVVEPRKLLVRGEAGSAADLAPPSFWEDMKAGSSAPPLGWSILKSGEVYVVSFTSGDTVVLATGPEGRLLLGWKDGEQEHFGLADPQDEGVVPLEAESFDSALKELASIA
jgi:hypothetical protein